MKRILSILLLLCCLHGLRAQSFKAQIEDVGGYYRLSFTVTSTDVSRFTPPSLNDFEVLNGPSSSTFSSYQIVNGKASHNESTTYTYILSARKSGKITIGPATIQANGRTLRSSSITLDARAGSQSNRSHSPNNGSSAEPVDETLQQAGSRVSMHDLFIDVTPSRTKVREQEAVLLTYKVHSRVGVGLANTQLTNKPDFKGVISQEIPLPGNQIQTVLEQRNGTTYRTGIILQYIVFPQQNGELVIPSITFDCTVVQQNRHMDLADAFFNGGGTIGVKVRREVPILKLQVEALPQPKPANFSGAVGRFEIEGKLLNPSIRTNDLATYRVTLKGLGNLKLITPPAMKFPTDFETYDPKTNENSEASAEGLTGELTFDYNFVPRNVGKYNIPALEFVYFDTEKGCYQTIRTQPLTLNVGKGERSNADVDHQLALLRSDIHNIHPANSPQALPAWLTWGNWSFALFNLILAILLATGIISARKWATRHADTAGRRRSGAAKQAAARLAEAEKLMQAPNQTDFYSAVSKALVGYLTDSFGIGQTDITNDNIRQLLAQKGHDEATIGQLIDLMKTCEFAQYAPSSDTERADVYNRALQLLDKLRK